jgi:hypothetical protein
VDVKVQQVLVYTTAGALEAAGHFEEYWNSDKERESMNVTKA